MWIRHADGKWFNLATAREVFVHDAPTGWQILATSAADVDSHAADGHSEVLERPTVLAGAAPRGRGEGGVRRVHVAGRDGALPRLRRLGADHRGYEDTVGRLTSKKRTTMPQEDFVMDPAPRTREALVESLKDFVRSRWPTLKPALRSATHGTITVATYRAWYEWYEELPLLWPGPPPLGVFDVLGIQFRIGERDTLFASDWPAISSRPPVTLFDLHCRAEEFTRRFLRRPTHATLRVDTPQSLRDLYVPLLRAYSGDIQVTYNAGFSLSLDGFSRDVHGLHEIAEAEILRPRTKAAVEAARDRATGNCRGLLPLRGTVPADLYYEKWRKSEIMFDLPEIHGVTDPFWLYGIRFKFGDRFAVEAGY